ncbi:MAG: hypothetical protein V3T88_02835, partial [Nitrosomonadaceae bacterium]
DTDDAGTVDDSISMRVFYSISDTATSADLRSAKSLIRLTDGAKGESLTSADKIFKKTFQETFDSATVNDYISKRVFYSISDTATSTDLLSTKSFIRLADGAKGDSVTASDRIIRKLSQETFDAATTSDSISKKVFQTTFDTVTLADSLANKAMYRLFDSVNVGNEIKRKFKTILVESPTFIDDFISFKISSIIKDASAFADSIDIQGSILIETRDEADNLIPGFEYLIKPNPFTGTGTLPVIDGVLNDNDMQNNGQIKVYYVPLGLYRINQTSVPAGNTTLYNYTYTTVHLTDINATALFRAVDSASDLTQERLIEGDIVDIDVPPTFDTLTGSTNLFKVRNSTQIPIVEVTDMPAPIFAGVSNASAIGNATEMQYSLFYQNIGALSSNERPEDISSAFGLTQYDAGTAANATNSTFVGIFTATDESPSYGQYVATQPLDKFNCGQEYVFELDESLVPSYGGMTRAEFTIDSAGTCPDAEDYNTFEITALPAPGSGAPALTNEDILLSVNARYPQATTGMGVNFRDPSNIDSYNFTMISTLPETGNINNLTMYVQNGGWTTTGVDILSRQLLISGPNAGMVQLDVSVDYLGHFIVGGKKIPVPTPVPTPPPATTQGPSSIGRVGVGPGS